MAIRLDFLQADRPKKVTGTESSHNHSHNRGCSKNNKNQNRHNVVLLHVVLLQVVLHHVFLLHVVFCHGVLYHLVLRHVVLHQVVLLQVVFCHRFLYHVVFRHVVLHQVVLQQVVHLTVLYVHNQHCMLLLFYDQKTAFCVTFLLLVYFFLSGAIGENSKISEKRHHCYRFHFPAYSFIVQLFIMLYT